MKEIISRAVQSLLLYPVKVKYCSQSIYRSLLGCLYLWDYTNDRIWATRADKLCAILINIQRPDGGFDNGYDYYFGRFHKKGESIAPELTGLTALVEYKKRFVNQNVDIASKKAVNWIAQNAFRVCGDEWAIPYGPYSSKEVMVYNGTSFAAGALGTYLSVFFDSELERIYHGMNSYLYNVMSSEQNQPGKFWYYSDQTRADLTFFSKNKIDYYHQMQQTEAHAIAELSFTSPLQRDIVVSAADHVAGKQKDGALIPYYNIKTDIHLWGYCSCASGFIMAAKLNEEKSSEYIARAKKIINWIIKYSWNGRYFYPIISVNGIVRDRKFYVRSDAWVFNAIALAIKERIIDESYIYICENDFLMMEGVDFSGIENHAINRRIKIVKKIASKIMDIWPR